MTTGKKEQEATAVILLNLGGPDSLEAVGPFLKNLFLDPEIIKLPIQPLTARIIAAARTRKVAERYQAIGGGSPIVKITQTQARRLERNLKARDLNCSVFVGMRYWHPFIGETVDNIVESGFQRLAALSLFPQYSQTTTGSCLAALKRALDRHGGRIEYLGAVESWPKEPLYIKALAETIEAGLAKFEQERREDVTLLFSAHSLPQTVVNDGDPYPEQTVDTIKSVLTKLGASVKWHLAYQSRSGPVRWLEPQTDEMIEKLGSEGVKNLLVVPVSFVGDHIETLYEIDMMYRDLALHSGVERFERAPALNDADKFIEALGELVARLLVSNQPKIQPPASSK